MTLLAESVLDKPPLELGLRISLSVMMFLQFAVWGAWFPVLGNYLGRLGFPKTRIGAIYGTMALGTIFAPLIVGQVADRFFASQWLMAGLHLAGAVLLFGMASVSPESIARRRRETAPSESSVLAAAGRFYVLALIYALIYSPTLALSNAIAFTHVPDATRDFPTLRVLGTIGWIAAGMIVGMVLPRLAGVTTALFGTPRELAHDPKRTNLPLILAGSISAVLGVWSLFLPHTPPKAQAGELLPFVEAFELLRQPSFAVFFGVSFVITIVLAFYYGFTGLWLENRIGIRDVASTMTIGQWSEIIFLLALPWFLRHLGMKWVLVIGMAAWGVRYLLFAVARPNRVRVAGLSFDPIILTLALHGICFDFFFAAGFIYVDNEAPSGIRNSAQALFTFLTYGLGMWIGNMVSGMIAEHYTDSKTNETDWRRFWLVPSFGVFAALAVFVAFFR